MKKVIILLVLSLVSVGISAETVVDSISGKKYKRGWTFGALPSVAYDADLGFQGGALANIYFYGDGSTYPEYLHSIYFEAAYTTNHRGIFRGFFDTKALIPNHRLTIDATYLPDAMCDFYGFNGYQAKYNPSWHAKAKKIVTPQDSAAYRSRAFYKYKRDLIRFAADIEGTIKGNWKWNAGLGVLGYIVQDVDIDMLNGKKKPKNEYTLLPDVDGLYEKYQTWGIIEADEASGGWHPYVRGGVTFDSRDTRANPSNGIYADAFFTYSAAFGNQKSYNNLRFNFTFRHYVTLYPEWLTFAYRVGTQNLIAGKSPFYANTYLNTLFIQRVIYEGLGGANSLRGIMANRINGDGYLYANVEFRATIAKFSIGKQFFKIGLNPLFDLGMITQAIDLNQTNKELSAKIVAGGERVEDYFDFDKKQVYRPHMSAGIGLKVSMNENFILSVDWAAPIDKRDNANLANFYVKMGYLF